jgi:hypothetical protein
MKKFSLILALALTLSSAAFADKQKQSNFSKYAKRNLQNTSDTLALCDGGSGSVKEMKMIMEKCALKNKKGK